MILVADSGSSKTHWKLIVSSTKTLPFETKGLNPYYCNPSEYHNALLSSFPSGIDPKEVTDVFFYGAGCSASQRKDIVINGLKLFFRDSTIKVETDILGAARALFGKEEGIVVILGTGSNTGYYDGTTIHQIAPSLGYILGDEGSGAYLGKKLIRDWLYGDLPAELAVSIEEYCHLKTNELLNRLYNNSYPNQFLASFVPFLEKNKDHKYVHSLVRVAFEKFTNRHLIRFSEFNTCTVGIVGSVGENFCDILVDVMERAGASKTKFLRYPIDGIVDYHVNN